jgi:hypothetical protein
MTDTQRDALNRLGDRVARIVETHQNPPKTEEHG